jgi:DNA-binding response OmpR family regulator
MSPATILVVDDEPDVCEVLRLLLAKAGHAVRVVSSGMDCLVQAQREPPDLILLDIMMPEMDGWETLKLLRLDETTRGIPVVIVSARVEPKDKIRGLQEGAVDYVTKPFRALEVADTVAAALQRARGATGA